MSGSARILDGREVARLLRDKIEVAIARYVADGGIRPGLAVLLVGDDPASAVYVRNKQQACEQVGIASSVHRFSADADTATLLTAIDRLNDDPAVHGILVQLPLPGQIDTQAVLEQVAVVKDVDGFNATNMGRLVLRDPGIRPCTPRGIMALLHHYGLGTRGKHAVVIGASNIVGRPMALELLLDGATVTVCHRFTRHLEQHVHMGEFVISAVGKPGAVDANWLRPGAVVVDVGMNRLEDGRLCGDLDADTVRQRASWYTPVPGGVGPMTVTMLMLNTIQAAGVPAPELCG